jgi:peptidoglycan-associated lipoprotein
MKKYTLNFLSILTCITLASTLTSCKKKRSKSQWDQTPVASRFASSSTLWSKDAEGEFTEFVSLKDDDLSVQYTDGALAQPAYSPGETGSGLPSLDFFETPKNGLEKIFKNIYFSTDSFTIKEGDYLNLVSNMGTYLKDHPNLYIVIEGFCDERGAEAYNLSLGAKRANNVRQLLVKKGAHPEQIHTISYGKEQPVDIRHSQDAWAKNRRAEFKVYQK